MQAARRGETLLETAEHHGERDVKGAVEAPDWMRKSIGMLLDGGGDPGVRELHEQRAAGTEKNRSLAVDLPGDGVRTKQARVGARRRRAREVQFALQAFRIDDVGGLFFHWGGCGIFAHILLSKHSLHLTAGGTKCLRLPIMVRAFLSSLPGAAMGLFASKDPFRELRKSQRFEIHSLAQIDLG